MAKKKSEFKKMSGLGPKKSKDIPVTKSMLDTTRAELKADITSLRLEMLSGFKTHDARFAHQVPAYFWHLGASKFTSCFWFSTGQKREAPILQTRICITFRGIAHWGTWICPFKITC